MAQGDRSWHRDWHYFQHQAHVARAAITAGVPPDHNTWHCSGSDQAENPQGLTTSPLFAPVFVLGPGAGLRAACLLFLLLGAAGMAWALRREDLSTPAAAAGGVLWGLSPFLVVHISEGHVPFAGFALIPLALALAREAYAADAAGERAHALSWAAGTGAVLGAQLCFGGVYPFPFTCLALGLDALARCARGRSLRPVSLLALMGITGFVLAFPRLLPAFDLVSRLPRPALWQDAMDIELLVRALFGRDVSTSPVPGHPYHRPEYVLYAGFAVLALAAAGAFVSARKPAGAPRVAVGLLAVTGGWLMLGEVALGLHRLLLPVPLLGDLQVPSRYGVLLLCGLCWRAARGADRLWRGRSWQRALAVLLFVAAAAELATLDAAWLQGAPMGHAGPSGVTPAPRDAGPFENAPHRMDHAPAEGRVVAYCYEPGPHLVPPALTGPEPVPFVRGLDGATVEVSAFAPGRISLSGPAGGWAAEIAQANDARWQVVGGSRVPGRGGLLRVEAKGTRLELVYRSEGRMTGLLVQLVLALALLVGAHRARRRRS